MFSSDFNLKWNFSTDFREVTTIILDVNPSSGAALRPTDMIKIIGTFRCYANAPKQHTLFTKPQKKWRIVLSI